MPMSATAAIAACPMRDLATAQRARMRAHAEKRQALATQRTIYWPQAGALAALGLIALMLLS
jgi:hypothetical protein